MNGVLVQFPWVCGVGPRSTVSAPVATGLDVDVVADPGVDVADEPPGTEVGVVTPDDGVGTVVAVPVPGAPESEAGGRVYVGVFACDAPAPPPPEFPMAIPMRTATIPTTTRCHVRHDRRSRILSSPGAGGPEFVGPAGIGLDHDPFALSDDSVCSGT